MNMCETMQDKELLNDLRSVAGDLGRLPTAKEYDEVGEYSSSSFQRVFGSWNEAVEQAGFEPNDPYDEVSDEKLLRDICSVGEKLGKTPSVSEYKDHGKYGAVTFHNHFGSWNEAVEQAGFEPQQIGSKISKENLLKDIRSVARHLDKVPTYNEYRNEGKYSVMTAQRVFGSWNEAVKQAGYIPHHWHNKIDDEKLLRDICSVARSLGKPPTKGEYDKHGEHYSGTVTDHFNTWRGALRRADCTYKPFEVGELSLKSDETEIGELSLKSDD
jgi:hypothetical protein